MTDTSIRVTRKVGAAAAVVFDLLANPDRHHEIDASGMVGDDEDASPITKVGQVFRMNMSSGDGAGEKYQVDNHVTQFQPNRRIAWEVGLVDGERLGWTWCYDLEPHGQDKSEVALTYDWSAVVAGGPRGVRRAGLRPRPARGLARPARLGAQEEPGGTPGPRARPCGVCQTAGSGPFGTTPDGLMSVCTR